MAGFVVLGSAGATPVAPAALAFAALDGAACLAAARANPAIPPFKERDPPRGQVSFLGGDGGIRTRPSPKTEIAYG